MGEVWAAAIGAAAAVAGTAYSISQSQAAIDAANSLKPKKFVPIDIGIGPNGEPTGGVALQALNADKAAYAATDALLDPRLKAGRDFTMNDMASDLTGAPNAMISSELKKAGLDSNFGSTLTEQARNEGKPILSLEQRSRNYFENLFQQNPQREFGIGDQLTALKLANTNALRNYQATVFGSRVGQYNSALQQNVLNQSAAVTALGGTVGTIGQIYQSSPYLRSSLSNYFGNAPYAGNAGDFAVPTAVPVTPPTG